MKKRTKKYSSGGMMEKLSAVSPAAALLSGNLDKLGGGLAGGALGMLLKQDEKRAAAPTDGKSGRASRAAPTRGMKAGGKVRGDGVCRQGKTKGTMR